MNINQSSTRSEIDTSTLMRLQSDTTKTYSQLMMPLALLALIHDTVISYIHAVHVSSAHHTADLVHDVLLSSSIGVS
jgi:hypothetical protein